MIRNTLSKVIIFTVGAAVGSAVTWKLVKDKYERMANEDIKAVRDFYNNRQQETKQEESLESDESEEPDEPKALTKRELYAEDLRRLGYTSDSSEKIEEEEDEDVSEPYVISPSEYGECDYETESLWYYEGDGVVTTYFGEVIEDVDSLIGADFASHYGEYEEDSVHVRNDSLKTDFEILRDYKSYSEN